MHRPADPFSGPYSKDSNVAQFGSPRGALFYTYCPTSVETKPCLGDTDAPPLSLTSVRSTSIEPLYSQSLT